MGGWATLASPVEDRTEILDHFHYEGRRDGCSQESFSSPLLPCLQQIFLASSRSLLKQKGSTEATEVPLSQPCVEAALSASQEAQLSRHKLMQQNMHKIQATLIIIIQTITPLNSSSFTQMVAVSALPLERCFLLQRFVACNSVLLTPPVQFDISFAELVC